ncbi:MAG: hypothetical protein CM1200mP2_14700 [Planctomycetaceae bacterium]|nr:MAG: hypothetical protein CM1200mP2_14700 [Planctomycetaceae bacterium]
MIPASPSRIRLGTRWVLGELLDDDTSRAELILRQTLSHPHAHTIIVGNP